MYQFNLRGAFWILECYANNLEKLTMFESTGNLSSRAPNDCAIVALTFAFNKTYEEIRNELAAIAVAEGIMWKFWKGTPHTLTNKYLELNGWHQVKVPRKNNRNTMTGIVSAHKAGVRTGHMFCVINGIVFDSSVPNGMSINRYMEVWRYHVRQLWQKKIEENK